MPLSRSSDSRRLGAKRRDTFVAPRDKYRRPAARADVRGAGQPSSSADPRVQQQRGASTRAAVRGRSCPSPPSSARGVLVATSEAGALFGGFMGVVVVSALGFLAMLPSLAWH
ncbi:MAG: hypothetical protein KBB21_16585 [Nannocystaceae bacterium]|nr:hypothetical protein [Nannocystaceae bacterium]